MFRLRLILSIVSSLWFLFACTPPPLYLKKFGPTIPTRAEGLKGKTVYVAPFEDKTDPDADLGDSKALDDPSGFKTKKLDASFEATWEKERDAKAEQIPEEKYIQVGGVRNSFGMTVQDVMSVNSPAEWLSESLAVELQAQGAKLVKSPAEADVAVSGVVKYVYFDQYMATWCNAVVELKITPRGGLTKQVRIHTSGGGGPFDDSPYEQYEILTQCEQRFSVHALENISEAAGAVVAQTQ